MFRLVKKQDKKPVSLREHHERRNKVLIKRRCGGFGDILMQRMMFEDFSKTGLEFTYTCPHPYLEVAKNHPFSTAIELSLSEDQDICFGRDKKFGITYDITTPCRVYEMKHAPNCQKHRSDIWAEYCGLELTNHDMFLTPDEVSVKHCQEYLKQINPDNKPVVILATKSSDFYFGKSKSLLDSQVIELVKKIRELGFFPISVHDAEQEVYKNLEVIQIITSINFWIAFIASVDYVISIDTSTFHLAGGLKKPLVGVFTFTDGKVYGKYFDFVLVQKHRDNGDWDCGPCFQCHLCPKEQNSPLKPCLTELTADEIIQGLQTAIKKWPVSRNDEKSS